MRVIASVEIQCDDCGHILRRQAVPHLPDLPFTRRKIMRRLVVLATRRGWSMEGPGLMAGDTCPSCTAHEKAAP